MPMQTSCSTARISTVAVPTVTAQAQVKTWLWGPTVPQQLLPSHGMARLQIVIGMTVVRPALLLVKKVGHFTAMVWKSSELLGCGAAEA